MEKSWQRAVKNSWQQAVGSWQRTGESIGREVDESI
jgi:hypothetical protein